MSLKKVAEWIGSRYIAPGDTISIVFDNPLTGEEEMVSHEVTREMEITTAMIYEFENEFELKEGFAGIIGN